MKILHVVPSYIPAWRYGGPIHSVHGLCKALAAKGHEVHVYTTNVDGPGDSNVPINTAVDIDGVIVRYYPSSNNLRRLFYSPMMLDTLKAQIKDFDLVHLHSVFLWPTWAAAKVARRSGIPYVISPRGMLVNDLIRRKSRLLKTLWLLLIERQNIEHASAIHVTSETEKEELQKFEYELPAVCSIPNGVDAPGQWHTEAISDDIRNVVEGSDYVLYFGRIHWKKGIDRLIKAWQEVKNSRLVIAGNDEEGYMPTLEAIVKEKGLQAHIVFIERSVKGQDKEALFASARLFVLPSYSENFGITVLEAMIRKLPVVVTAEVGAAEIVKAAGAGVITVNEPGVLADEINRLLCDKNGLLRMGEAGHKFATENYLWDAVADGMYHDCYKSIKIKV